MGRCPLKGSQCQGIRRGAWTREEDNLLRKCVEKYGTGKWCHVPKRAGLNRCRKSCRLRWLNYLSPGIKRGRFDADEDDLIIRVHKLVGNRWSLIAGRLPGRTANDVKNYWNSHLSKRLEADYTTRVASDATIARPHPQTIPVDWSWSHHDQMSVEANRQELKSDAQIQPLVLNNPTALADDVIICEGPNHATSHVGLMALELDTNLRIDGKGGIGDDDIFLGGFAGWKNFLSDLNMWDDFSIV